MKITTRYQTLMLAFVAISGPSPLIGQVAQPGDSDKDPTRLKLSKTVHLNLGATTVDAVMATLSTQTGLTVKAADYLRERKLIARMDNLSASAALDALADLNDWTWSRTLPNQILVTPRRLRLDATAAAVPRMMQAAIPRDIRTFLKIRIPNDDMSTYVNPLTVIESDPKQIHHNKLHKAVAVDQSALLISLAPQILTGKPISYANLNPKQRDQLLMALVFPLLWQTDYRLLHDDIMPHVAAVNSAVISMAGETTLIIGSEYKAPGIKSSAGFGTQIR